MIILDESVGADKIRDEIRAWHKCEVTTVHTLGFSGMQDTAIPALLRRHPGCIFVTDNWSDFWNKVKGHPDFTIICFDVSGRRQLIPGCLKLLLKQPDLRTRKKR